MTDKNAPFTSGFVALVGRPNAGKSTLLNAIMGEKLAITSPVAQTTRRRMRAVVNTDHSQLVIIDTEYTGEADYDPFVLINPRIVEQSDSTFTFNEGCLSIPGINVEIERADHVAVEAYDLNGDLMRYEADGDLLCVCLQHEIDHLHGITMFERLSPMKRIAAMRDYQQARARGAKPGDTE